MTGPYRPGDRVAWIDADDTGVRVSRVTVLTVERAERGWSVETTQGRESVDQRGEGSRVVPIDDELEHDFEVRGDTFIVQSTVQEIAQHLDPQLDWRRFERELDPDRDPDRDYDR